MTGILASCLQYACNKSDSTTGLRKEILCARTSGDCELALLQVLTEYLFLSDRQLSGLGNVSVQPLEILILFIFRFT